MHVRTRVTLLFAVVPLFASDTHAAPIHLWSHGFGDTAPQSTSGVAIDGSGHTIAVGEFRGTIDLGGGPLTATDYDIWIGKFDGSGNHLWSKHFSGIGNDFPISIGVDAGDNIILGGTFESTIDFGGGPLTSAGWQDLFVVKLDVDGDHVWSRRYGDAADDPLVMIGIDGAGGVGVCATFGGTIDFGGGPLESAGGNDVAVAKLDATGNHIWSRRYGDANLTQYSREIAFDPSGNVLFLAQFRGSMDFGGGSLTSVGSSYDMAMVKLDPAGNYIWSYRFGNNANQFPSGIAADALGNVFIAGSTGGDLDFGGGMLIGAGGNDDFVAKFDASGNHAWSKLFGDASSQLVVALAVDGPGNVHLAGSLLGSMDLGGGSISSVGNTDVFVARLDPNGNHLFSVSYGDSGSDYGHEVAVGPSGAMALAGSFTDTIDFGGGPIAESDSTDAFVARFTVDGSTPVLINHFEAVAHAHAIELGWDLFADAVIDRLVLYRRDRTSEFRTILDRAYDRGLRSYIDTDVEAGVTYSYELVFRTRDGEEYRSPVATATMTPFVLGLEQNRPNPFNPRTTIAYTVSERANVAIVIYDAEGAEIARLDQGTRGSGRYEVEWDGRDSNGRACGNGVYFYRLEGSGWTYPRKLVLLK